MGALLLLLLCTLMVATQHTQAQILDLPAPRPALSILDQSKASPKKCLDQEIIVASQVGGPGVLRAISLTNGEWTERIISNVPVRIESIDIGTIGVGARLPSIAAGLAEPYPGSSGAVRIYSYDQSRARWNERSLGTGIQNNVEAIAIGDLESDGSGEVIAGLEGYTNEPRLLAFKESNGWIAEPIAPANYQPDIQHVSVVDLYGTGEQGILALAAFPPLGSGSMELRWFRKSHGVWSSQLIAQNVAGYSRAERFVASNLDADPELEIVVGMWSGLAFASGALVMLDYNGTSWETVVMNGSLGAIDAIGVGRYSSATADDILVGTTRQVLRYTRSHGTGSHGAWAPQVLIPSINAFASWDADFGKLSALGQVGLVALDNRLVLLRPLADGSSSTTTIRTFAHRIDSAQMADVDGVTSACALSTASLMSSTSLSSFGSDFLRAPLP